METKNLNEIWETTGMIPQSFELSNPEIIPLLKRDLKMYRFEVERNKQDGLNRVPYLLTDAIIKTAYDSKILEIVKAVLLTDELVMWGANLQRATPNEAGLWHTDIEAWLWPSITMVIGLDGCNGANSTKCIPGSHRFGVQPWRTADNHCDAATLKSARKFDENSEIRNFPDFGDGKFYLFDAKCWHAGAESLSAERELLFLHFDKASNPRIPYMKDYEENTWFDFPATYLQMNNGKNFEINQSMYSIDDKDYVGEPPEGLVYEHAITTHANQ